MCPIIGLQMDEMLRSGIAVDDDRMYMSAYMRTTCIPQTLYLCLRVLVEDPEHSQLGRHSLARAGWRPCIRRHKHVSTLSKEKKNGLLWLSRRCG